jgi:hypothetical protein
MRLVSRLGVVVQASASYRHRRRVHDTAIAEHAISSLTGAIRYAKLMA